METLGSKLKNITMNRNFNDRLDQNRPAFEGFRLGLGVMCFVLCAVPATAQQDQPVLDSITYESRSSETEAWQTDRTEVYDISGNGRQIVESEYRISEDGGRVPVQKTEYRYDNQFRRTYRAFYEPDQGDWTYDQGVENVYLDNDLLKHVYSYDYDPREDSIWRSSWMEYHYNDAFRLDSTTYRLKSAPSEAWGQVFGKTIISYDSLGRKVETQSWRLVPNTGQYHRAERFTYNYDVDGNLTFRTRYRWNIDEWEPRVQDGYTYDQRSRVVKKVRSTYRNQKETVTPLSEIRYQYNTENSVLEELTYDYVEDGSRRIRDYKRNHTYDQVGNRRSTLKWTWNDSSASWQRVDSIRNRIDTDYLAPAYKSAPHIEDNTFGMALAQEEFTFLGDTARFLNRLRFHYDGYTVTSLKERQPRNQVHLYPNPFHENVYMELSKPIRWLSVHDPTGRSIYFHGPCGAGVHRMDLHASAARCYLVRWMDMDGRIWTDTLLKK